MYLHGLEGSPQGTKGQYMVQSFGATAPDMPAIGGVESAFDDSYAVAREAVARENPSVVVGSSFGGAILMRLVLEGHWRGPCVFLASAGYRYGLGDSIPEGIEAIFIHAREDRIIPFEDSERVVRNSGPRCQLWPTDGDHRLHHIVSDGLLYRAVTALLP